MSPTSSQSTNDLPRWFRALSHLPWGVHYALATFVAVLMHRVLRYRLSVVRANIAASFPELDARALRKIERSFYRNITDVVAEFIKSATLSPEELRSRVTVHNLEIARSVVAAGRSVLLVGAHQSNWEWLPLVLALELGYPLDAGYKPMRQAWSERLFRNVRTRFGSRLVPAKEILANILAERGRVRAIALLADQSPMTSEYRWWTRFLNQPTAFYMGPEKIARAARYPMFFVAMRRVARGRYEIHVTPIAGGQTTFESGAPTEHYARLVEAEIRASPGDWMWSHRRWKLQQTAPAESATTANRTLS